MKLFYVVWEEIWKGQKTREEGYVIARSESNVLDVISQMPDTKYQLVSPIIRCDFKTARILALKSEWKR